MCGRDWGQETGDRSQALSSRASGCKSPGGCEEGGLVLRENGGSWCDVTVEEEGAGHGGWLEVRSWGEV